MTQIVGALTMGLFFLLISGELRAKFIDGLAAAATAIDQCGVSAYVGLAIIVVGGFMLVLNSGPETQGKELPPLVLKKKKGGARQDKPEPSKLEI